MTNNRPLSPHLSIHKKIATAIFSIFHRITGVGLSAGAILICVWIALIALGEEYYLIFKVISSSFVFILILFIWTIGIFYHLFNGIRYLFWSYGAGMSIKTVYTTGYLVLFLTLLSTLCVWFVL